MGNHISELLFALAGALFLASAFVVYQAQDFTLWHFAKLFYVVALLLFVKYS
ncbi:MAG TPA: hypothetical protein VFE94_00310 [Candidatus Paceibacterota bacterium]|nr:hypothetical protein [Candidatus Paceibacterota bacterium]